METSSQATRRQRTLNGYRAAVAVLLLVIVGLVVAFERALDPAPPPPVVVTAPPAATGGEAPPAPPQPDQRRPGTIQIFDLSRRLGWIGRNKRDWADISETFYRSRFGTVHLHAMGLRQICPLHLHRSQEELTVIVGGTARVRAHYGEAGALRSHEALHRAGSLLLLPPGSGHRFDNVSADGMLGNLVFASRPFGGNLYLDPRDPRLRSGRRPVIRDAEAEAARFAASSAPLEQTRLPGFGGRLLWVLVKTRLTLPPAGGQPLVAYAAKGRAELETRTGKRGLAPRRLALLHHLGPLQLRVTAPPLVLLLFRPEGPWPAEGGLK